MTTAFEERKREVAMKALVASTKSFHDVKKLDVNKRQLFRFKNPLSDMNHTETVNWLETALKHSDAKQLDKFIETCKENGVSGPTACKWTDGILASDSYGISDKSLRSLILVERDNAIKIITLPPVFETFTKEASPKAKFRASKERVELPGLVQEQQVKEISLKLPVFDYVTRKHLEDFTCDVVHTAELVRVAWIAFACMGDIADLSGRDALCPFLLGLTDHHTAFVGRTTLRVCDLTREQIAKLCIVKSQLST